MRPHQLVLHLRWAGPPSGPEPTPPWTLTRIPSRMMHATTDCGRRHGRCGLAAEPWPREVGGGLPRE